MSNTSEILAMNHPEESKPPKKRHTQTEVLFFSGGSNLFCCKSWDIEPLTHGGARGINDAKHPLALKLLAFINSGMVRTGWQTDIQKHFLLQDATWLVQLARKDCVPEMWVYLAESEDNDGGEEENNKKKEIKEFGRGKECFKATNSKESEEWKVEEGDMIGLRLVCKVHDQHWDCHIIKRKD